MSAACFHSSTSLQQRLPAVLAARWPTHACSLLQSFRLPSLRNVQTAPATRISSAHSSSSSLALAVKNAAIYDSPELYDRAFSFRDFDEEVQFLQTILQSCGDPSTKSFLELGCGPARHAALLQLKTGSKAFASDKSQAMLAYAKDVAKKAGASVQFSHADMRHFKVQERVDMVFMLLGTFSHLLDTESALQCLRSVQQALKPGGLLVLELDHPSEAFDGSLMQGDSWRGEDADESPLEDGEPGELAVQYGKASDPFDPIEQVMHRTVTILQGDASGSMQQVIKESVAQRIFTYQEMLLLAASSKFRMHQAYGDLLSNVPIDDPDAARMVVVLQPE